MAERKSLDGLTLREFQGTRIMSLGDMEIWDGADLALLRDGLNHVILKERQRVIAIDMTYVKYVPSGFFGMLFDWFEKGVTIRLYAPQERVASMLWFRQFFQAERDGWHILHTGMPVSATSSKPVGWDSGEWEIRKSRAAAAVAASN